MTRLSAKTEIGVIALTRRSSASVEKSASNPAATGSSAATTPRKIQSASKRSNGNAISSARSRSRSDCAFTCSFASDVPPTSPGSERASDLTPGASVVPYDLNHAVTSTCFRSRETAARGWTMATYGCAFSRSAATAAWLGVATTISDGPGSTPVARDSSCSVRKLSERLSWKSLSLDLSRDGVDTPNAAATTTASTAAPTIARGRR